MFFFSLYRNRAIADYLSSNGYISALTEFQKEASMVNTSNRFVCTHQGVQFLLIYLRLIMKQVLTSLTSHFVLAILV